jgi:DNA-binding MurR/RpiR family transcriptional regulator
MPRPASRSTPAAGGHADAPKLPAALVRGLSAKRRELVMPILEHPRDYVLLSVRKLGEALGADPMAVLRAIRDMGFEGYAEFRRYLHELALVQATQLDTLVGTRDPDLSADLQESLSQDANNLAVLRGTVDVPRLETLANRLYDARRIVLLGGDMASVLVQFLQYNLAVIDLPATACTRPGEVVHGVRGLTRSDVVIAITFRRGLRQTVEGVRQARAKGAYCVGVTDTHLSPLARFAQEYFVAPVDSPLYGVSYVAPMSLLNVLLAACVTTRRKRTLQLLKTADAEQRAGFRWYRDESRPPTRRPRRRAPPLRSASSD